MKKTILVIEDNPVAVELATHYLQQRGYEVVSTFDAEHGLLLAERLRPDLIACDIKMPRMNGLEFAREARRRGIASPLVAVTSATLDSDRGRALEAGFVDYIEKPVDMRTFVDRLEKHIK